MSTYISIDEFRKIIKDRRKSLRYSLQDVADKAGLNRNTLKQIEDGVIVEPGLVKSLGILNALEFDVWKLLKDQGAESEIDYLTSLVQKSAAIIPELKNSVTEVIRKAALPYQAKNILVVDDQDIALEGVKALLLKNHYTVETANNYQTAITALQTFQPDISIIDIDLKEEKDGIDILSYVRQNYPRTECIMMSMYKNQDKAIEALNKGAFDYYDKDDDDARLLHAVKRIERARQVS